MYAVCSHYPSYGMTLLPPGPRETTQYKGCITKNGVCGDGCNPTADPTLNNGVCINGMPMQWRLERDEAVVLIAQAPSRSKYWSVTSYLMSRFYKESPRIREPTLTWIQGLAVKCPDVRVLCVYCAYCGSTVYVRYPLF